MSVGEIAGLIAAAAFVVLVALLALPLVRLTGAIEEARRSIERLTEETIPTLRGTATTVESVNTSLGQAEGITSDARDMSANINGLTALVTTTVAGPLVKASAFSYGVRRALAHRRVPESPQQQRARERADRRAARTTARTTAREARRGAHPGGDA